MEFNYIEELANFKTEFENLNVDVTLFDTEKGQAVIEHFLKDYAGFSKFTLKNKSFIPSVYPYIELAHRNDFTLEKVFTVIAQDFQTFED